MGDGRDLRVNLVSVKCWLCFRIKDNWSDQIIFIYILLIVGTDKRVIMDSDVREAIRTGVHYHLDSFR